MKKQLILGTIIALSMLIGMSSGANIITYDAEDITNESVSLKGNLAAMSGETSVTVYFRVGLINGALMAPTKEQVLTGTGNFSADDFKSALFFGDEDYKYQAVGIFGDDHYDIDNYEYGDTKYFTISSVGEFGDRNLSSDYDDLDFTNLSIYNFANSTYNVFNRAGTGFGQMFLFIILSLPFIAMYIRQQSVLIPSLIYLMLSSSVYIYFPGTLRPLIYGLLCLAIFGMGITIMKGRK